VRARAHARKRARGRRRLATYLQPVVDAADAGDDEDGGEDGAALDVVGRLLRHEEAEEDGDDGAGDERQQHRVRERLLEVHQVALELLGRHAVLAEGCARARHRRRGHPGVGVAVQRRDERRRRGDLLIDW